MSGIKDSVRVNLIDMFTVPPTYKPPVDLELKNCTLYPNLNSREYRILESPKYNTKLHKFFETFDVNELGNVVLGCNDQRSRIWKGSFLGFESIDDIGIIDKVSYKSHMKSFITNIKFVAANIILITDAVGGIELWSTHAEVRNKLGYCLFKIGYQVEHVGVILSLELFNTDRNKAITGSNDNCIKIWDMGSADIVSTHTFKTAHSEAVTGISSSYASEKIFASCSRDKTISIWDARQSNYASPAIEYYDKHNSPFTSIYWTSSNEHNEQLFAGDETGKILIIDPRKSNEQILTIDTFNAQINKIRFKGNTFAVSGCTKEINVIDCKQNYAIIYSNKKAEDYVRDMYWNNTKELYTIGWDTKFRKHLV